MHTWKSVLQEPVVTEKPQNGLAGLKYWRRDVLAGLAGVFAVLTGDRYRVRGAAFLPGWPRPSLPGQSVRFWAANLSRPFPGFHSCRRNWKGSASAGRRKELRNAAGPPARRS